MKSSYIITLLLFAGTLARGQNCNCEQKFQFIRHEIETNYAGYKDKVNAKNRQEYEKLTKKYLDLVKKTKKESYCFVYMYDWLKFFKDGHVQLNGKQGDDSLSTNERIKETEVINIPAEKLKQLSELHDTPEGIYAHRDSLYTIAIVKNKNEYRDYVGVIYESRTNLWKPGQVKIELKKENDSTFRTVLYMRDHRWSVSHFGFDKNSYNMLEWTRIGHKTDPAGQQKSDAFMKKFEGFEDVRVKRLSDSTFYIQIATFRLSNAKMIDSVIKANDAILKTTPNLIIDVRGNGGGSDDSYQPLLPYLYTGPVIEDGNDIYATPDNIRRYTNQIIGDADQPENSKNEMREMIARLQQHIGAFAEHAGDHTISFDKTEPYPKKVVILINKGCASSTEQFLLSVRPSAKVTLMGEHTYGELDYSNVLLAESPCKGIQFGYSSTRSRRIVRATCIDNIGIKPDIRLSDDKDWAEEARKYLEK